jgi:hypothetical protein
VGIDRPDDADASSDEPARRPNGSGDGGSAVPMETRSRQEYYDDLRAAVSREEARTAPNPTGNGKPWQEVTAWSSRVWAEYTRKWPPEERTPVDRSADPPGSWRGDNNQFLDRATNEEMDEECDQLATWERERTSPAMLEVEGHDPDRHLVGFDYRLKGRDRIKEKAVEAIGQFNRSPKEAISDVPDTVRYTFQYQEARYAQGVWDDIARLKERGFDMVKLRNSWSAEQYKGINSQWVDPSSGRRFELQFHTQISFEAKQITHGAYERLRSGQTDEFEEMVLEAFQRKVSSEIPVPFGAKDIPDYPERERDAR